MRTSSISLMLLVFQLMLVCSSLSQPANDPRNFYKNVVEIGDGEFGTIVGDDDIYCYFICIRNVYDKKIGTTLDQIRYYNGSVTKSASFIKEFYFGIYQVLLYQCEKDPGNHWQKRYFGSIVLNMVTASTFVDNDTVDATWALSAEIILLHDILKGGTVVMTVPKDLKVKRGMPMISNTGFVAGIFAEDANGTTWLAAINMRDIAELIYIYSDCRYFNMIEFKRHANRCVLEQFDSQVKSAKNTYSPPEKLPRVTFGLFGNVVAPSRDDGAGVSPLNYGASLYLNIDQRNRQRISMKIGLVKYAENNLGGLWKSPDGKLEMTQTSYEIVSQSFLYERQFYRFKSLSGSVALGYNLGITSEQVLYIKKTNVADQSIRYGIDKTALLHRLDGEVYFLEWKIFRLGMIFWQDFGKYPNARYSFNLDGTTYKPLESRKKIFYHGFEASFRFGGAWANKKSEN